ncbi:carbamate kinase [Paraburkholderia caballeronis]|uniref:Carbamate kinase n=1 Tax=Paraburkholderia caballeronis TaxID=416943 RepID=A0A1H7VNW3_9BURK|nr:carbamate kinase [Paraburkholderia caballeronis]PXW14944.1 carbamate kinase [Paraburkholderia caballeronis]PXW93577.1 carbamate kinase [Paraburkholderia caballeronis]RAJ88908.1 carbamate kinase [Paraburkholderia caballeronis]SED96899.1 carbamate kinase [Paraburkholderia caballeronis]SEM11002.1 carbamate kinase [Paraburkholderia caballeronis]
MRIVVALGGNALLRRGEAVSPGAQLRNVKLAAARIAAVAQGNELVIVHGNGPQVGLLATLGGSAPASGRFPLDVLDAETEGMIGYLIELELRNRLPASRPVATLLTMVEVDANDPAFKRPDKPVGPMLTQNDAASAAQANGWTVAQDGDGYRRVVASPRPLRFLEIEPVRALLTQRAVVICAGGGGIPVTADADGQHHGIEAVVDKDRSAALLAHEVGADLFVIATDVDGVYLDWGKPDARPVRRAHPDSLAAVHFAAGSMGPKVEAACAFARQSGQRAVIGSLADIDRLVTGEAGTSISAANSGVAQGEMR